MIGLVHVARTVTMPASPLSYESVPLHPGRFRVDDTPDALEISLVRRSAWGKLPAILLIWVGLAALGIGLWWLAGRMTYGRPSEGKLIFVTLSLPFSALVFSLMLVMQDRQQLSIRVDAGGVTVTRTMMGTPDRQRFAMGDLLHIGFDPGTETVIAFTTAKGTTNVLIARKPVYVREILDRIVDRVRQCRSGDPAGGIEAHR